MKMTYTKSQFEMPDGKYVAKFLGVTMREEEAGAKPRLGQDGKPLPPAMTWDFEIVEGPEAGKRADKLTGRIASGKSGCAKMLAAVSDTILGDGVEVDLDRFVGKFYRITVQENRISDSPWPILLPPDYRPATAPNGRAAAPAAPPSGNGGTPNAGDPAARWDMSDGAAVMLAQTSLEVQAFLTDGKIDAAKIRVKPAGAARELAKPANEYGFISGDVIPW